MSSTPEPCWMLDSFFTMAEDESDVHNTWNTTNLIWSKISNGPLNNEVWPVNILNVYQRKSKPIKKKNKWSTRNGINHMNFFLQNKFFESSQGDPDNFLTHNNHKQ